jgi:hypothetical protein
MFGGSSGGRAREDAGGGSEGSDPAGRGGGAGGRVIAGDISIIWPQPAHLPMRPMDVGFVNSFAPQWPQTTTMAPGGTLSGISSSLRADRHCSYFLLKPWFVPPSS